MSVLQIRGRLWERAMISALFILLIFYTLGHRSAITVATFGLPAGGYLARWSESHRKIELADTVTWGDFAYSTYATGTDHLCNSVMLMESLLRVGAKADRSLLYSSEWDIEDVNSTEARLLRRARDKYGVKVQPIQIIRPDNNIKDLLWAEGFTKLLAFNQTQYKRVLTLDSDATILRPLDELFLMPPAPLAIPRAYWLNDSLSAQVTLVQPSAPGFQAIRDQIRMRKADDNDMEIINAVYGSGCAILPHRSYNLLTGEFRAKTHAKYLGTSIEKWNAEAVIQEAKYVHFSDWPLPKPWQPHDQQGWDDMKPKCVNGGDCAELRIWTTLYENFRERRVDVCGVQFDTWSTAEKVSHAAPPRESLGDMAMAEALGFAGEDDVALPSVPSSASNSAASAQSQATEAAERLETEEGTVVQVVVVDADGKLQPGAVASEEEIRAKMAEEGLGDVKWRVEADEKTQALEAKLGGLV